VIRDPIVDEVRAIREELSARFDFDLRKIVEDAQRRQAASQSRVVSFQRPTPSLQPPAAANSASESSQLRETTPAAEV
jgi:hypothetical protein